MRALGLLICLVLCATFAIPLSFAHRDENTTPPAQVSVGEIPAAKLGFKGASACNCSGKWQTNWGEMTLVQAQDNTVTGAYTYDQGKIEGSMSGNLFSGRWSESPSYQDPNDGGLVELTFSGDCSSFTGRWKYGTSGDWKENDWSGNKIGPATKVLYPG